MKRFDFHIFFFIFLPLLSVITGCREDELVVPTEYDIDRWIRHSRPKGIHIVKSGADVSKIIL